MEQAPQIDEKTLEILISKYKHLFETKFPKLQLNIYFTSSGQPPDAEETVEVTGAFVKNGRKYLIGINQNQSVELKLLAFFHEFGHALYRREASEEICDRNALIRTETEALKKSLELADVEGLPQIAAQAVMGALELAAKDPVYQAAMNGVKNSPLWLKYFPMIREYITGLTLLDS